MREIEHSLNPPFSKGKIAARNDMGKVASLEYSFSEKKNCWYWSAISSGFPGGGKSLTRAFIETVGKGALVYMSVGEKETRRKLKEAGIVKEVIVGESGKLDMVSGDIMNSLKMVRMLRSGGMEVLKVTIERVVPNPIFVEDFNDNYNYPYFVGIFAKT